MKKTFTYLLLAIIIIGCGKTRPLHIGSKDFTEQFILAEMVAQLLENEKIVVKRSFPYGDTFSLLEAIKHGDLDIYVEYNGTGLIMLGQPPVNDGDEAFEKVKKLFQPLGLEWLDRLGFANNYVLLMRRDRALSLKISKISDLTKIPTNIKLAVEPEFITRPLDGLSALQRRYGLNRMLPIIKDNDKSIVYQALLDGKVDVAEGFSTEGRIEDFGLTVLEDDLEFFPVYQPSPLVRASTLERYPKLRPILKKLTGLIDTTSMRQMNREVELEGQDYQVVARDFLIKHQLIKQKAKSAKSEELTIVAGLLNDVSGSISKALRAVRKTFPGRRVNVSQLTDPLAAIQSGEARLGILSAEAFFTLTDDFLPLTNKTIEAVGVIGNRMAHIVTLQNSDINSMADIKKLGVGVKNGASARSAEMIFTSLEKLDNMELLYEENLSKQVQALKNNELDALFLMVPVGHEELMLMMNQEIFKLLSLTGWKTGNNLIRFPFFRLARIPMNTYEQQSSIIETVSTQMVLAGPTPIDTIIGDRGPATVISANVQPLSDSLVLQLNKELSIDEKLDPAIPAANILNQQTKPLSNPLNPSKIESIFNFFIMLAIAFLFFLFIREEKT
ncbi:glycine betaine ABC transporter substrate-binding protein [Candidatus Halobeggiatoa sp. HSG11]|nr:glycine betaine ABC transporter substrate-binding protein [Candidatus Halobeggiatoa sp. HSG11]